MLSGRRTATERDLYAAHETEREAPRNGIFSEPGGKSERDYGIISDRVGETVTEGIFAWLFAGLNRLRDFGFEPMREAADHVASTGDGSADGDLLSSSLTTLNSVL